jgi:hypothetical protein
MLRKTTILAAGLGLLILGVPDAPRAAAAEPLLRLRAFAMDRNASPAVTTTLEITIDRWSTDAEQERLQAALKKGGGDALVEQLQKLPKVGSISTTGRLGWDLHFARQDDLAQGVRRIVFGTDRPMNFWEMWNRPRSSDYTLMLGEVKLPAEGAGEGTFFSAARAEWNEGTKRLEIENYNLEPVRLTEVKIDK